MPSDLTLKVLIFPIESIYVSHDCMNQGASLTVWLLLLEAECAHLDEADPAGCSQCALTSLVFMF